MQKALVISHIRQLDKIGDFGRIYYGTEFCQNLIPTLDDLKRIFSLVKRKKKNFTLLTPYVTDFGVKKIAPLLEFLDTQAQRIEVVFNDWGVFKLIREGYKNLEPVLGRLLTKQRRDPRAYDILLNRQKAKKIFDKKSKKTAIIIPKKVPLSLYEHFKASVINMPIFQKFLLDNNIKRVEIDNLVWDMKIEMPKEIGVSVYLPYAYVTTTRLCGLINLTYAACKKECQRFYFSFKSNSSPVPFYSRGNTLFYRTEFTQGRDLVSRGIDRIVWEEEIPVK